MSLRGVRIQRSNPSLEPKPLMQYPSSASDEETEEWANKGFSAESSTASKPKTTNSKPKTKMGPKSKVGVRSNTADQAKEFDDIQMALALSMDPKQQKDKDNEQLVMALEKSKEDLADKNGSTKDTKSQSTKTTNGPNKKPTEKSNRPFNGRSTPDKDWIDDGDISSDENLPLKLSNKAAKKETKDASKKAAASKSKKRSRALSESSSEDEGKSAKNSKSSAKKTNGRTAQKTKQQSKRPKYKEVSSDYDDDDMSYSEDEVVPNKVKNISKEFQPAPKRTLSKRKAAKESESEDGEYDPNEGRSEESKRKSSRRSKAADSDDSPLEVLAESRPDTRRSGKGKPSKLSMGKHPIPNDQILNYVGSERTILYISCIAKQIVDSQRMRLFVDMYANKNLDIDKSHPLHEMAPADFYIDDGEINKKLEELLEKPIEAGKAILTEDGKYPFDDDIKQKFLRFVLIPECIIHLLKKQFSMGDQDAEEFYQQSGSRA